LCVRQGVFGRRLKPVQPRRKPITTAAKAAAPRPAISMRWRARRSLVRDSGSAMRGADGSPSRTIASASSATRSGHSMSRSFSLRRRARPSSRGSKPTVAAAESTEEATVGAEGAELLPPGGRRRHGRGRNRHSHLGHRNGDRGHGNGDRRHRNRNSVRQGVPGHEAGSQQDCRRCYGPHTWITLEGPNRLRRLRGKTQFSKDGRCR
jgi:hypothetical protein